MNAPTSFDRATLAVTILKSEGLLTLTDEASLHRIAGIINRQIAAYGHDRVNNRKKKSCSR